MALGALLRGRFRAFSNSGRLLRQQSWLKILVVTVFGAVLFASLGVLFYEGFDFLHRLGGAGLMVIHRLFALFFFGLGIMLLFSSIVTSYATLYRSPEVPALLVRPVTLGELTLFKSLESAIYSSWAFFFMILPFVGAFAVHQKLGVTFSLWTLLFSIPFVLLFSALGTILCMVLVRWLPSGRALYLLVAGVLLVLVTWAARIFLEAGPMHDDAGLVLTRLIPGLRISSHPVLPSWWISEGIMSLARGDNLRGFLLWLVLVANVLAAGLVLEYLGHRLFYEGWLKSTAGRGGRLGAPARWDGLLLLLPGAAPDTRALLMKDMRLFLRDPVQWSQALVFFGLLALYFLNLRQLHYHLLPPEWRNLIVFLNLFSVSAVTCSLSSRFIYPQMSMEGHSFWLLGLSPLTMLRILRAKYGLSAGLLMSVSLALMMLSSAMLQVDGLLRVVSAAVALCISAVVSAMSLGLGAMFADMKERNPAAIVSSFGGTLNLVLCMGYTIVAVFPFAGIFHLHAMDTWSDQAFRLGLGVAAFLLLVATGLGIWLPLRGGRRSLLKHEF